MVIMIFCESEWLDFRLRGNDMHEVQRLKLEVAEYKRREHLWRERWQRIAFHIRQKGLQVHEVDQSAPENSLTERETNNILKLFDVNSGIKLILLADEN